MSELQEVSIAVVDMPSGQFIFASLDHEEFEKYVIRDMQGILAQEDCLHEVDNKEDYFELMEKLQDCSIYYYTYRQPLMTFNNS